MKKIAVIITLMLVLITITPPGNGETIAEWEYNPIAIDETVIGNTIYNDNEYIATIDNNKNVSLWNKTDLTKTENIVSLQNDNAIITQEGSEYYLISNETEYNNQLYLDKTIQPNLDISKIGTSINYVMGQGIVGNNILIGDVFSYILPRGYNINITSTEHFNMEFEFSQYETFNGNERLRFGLINNTDQAIILGFEISLSSGFAQIVLVNSINNVSSRNIVNQIFFTTVPAVFWNAFYAKMTFRNGIATLILLDIEKNYIPGLNYEDNIYSPGTGIQNTGQYSINVHHFTTDNPFLKGDRHRMGICTRNVWAGRNFILSKMIFNDINEKGIGIRTAESPFNFGLSSINYLNVFADPIDIIKIYNEYNLYVQKEYAPGIEIYTSRNLMAWEYDRCILVNESYNDMALLKILDSVYYLLLGTTEINIYRESAGQITYIDKITLSATAQNIHIFKSNIWGSYTDLYGIINFETEAIDFYYQDINMAFGINEFREYQITSILWLIKWAVVIGVIVAVAVNVKRIVS